MTGRLVGGGRKRTAWLVLGSILLLLTAFEIYRVYTFAADLTGGQSGLEALESGLDLAGLSGPEADIENDRDLLVEAHRRLDSARGFVEGDPLVSLATHLPLVGKQAQGLQTLVIAGEEAAEIGLLSIDVALAFSRYEPDAEATSLEAALDFIESQEEQMAAVRESLDSLLAHRAKISSGLIGPMASATNDFDRALGKLTGLVEGYERASTLLPEILGFEAPQQYLLLLQNDTELFPSGGLISSYGIVTFDGGRLTQFDIEYFGTLYERWQRESGGEYVEPPAPLKQYLKRDISWALGEAGWYPDFPTTAGLAQDFVTKGGAPSTTGTLAIDIQFMSALLDLLGSVHVPEYDVTVTPENVAQITLENTRNDDYVPGQPKKVFLSYFAREVLEGLFAIPKEKWPEMLQVLDKMGQERHLQINFTDQRLQEMVEAYGFDGALLQGEGDFLLIADTSVQSTKLNLILEPQARLDVNLATDGSARSIVTYVISNPFLEWKQGRDSLLVEQLMLQGVYGSYLRLYVPAGAQIRDVSLDGSSAGLEQIDSEFGRTVFGRFFTVRPDQTVEAQFTYEIPGVLSVEDDGTYLYALYLQKQAGTDALPVSLRVELPPGAELAGASVDDEAVSSLAFDTDLRVDRQIEVRFRLP